MGDFKGVGVLWDRRLGWIGGYGGLVWLALAERSCYLYWVWGRWCLLAFEGLAFFPARKMPLYLILFFPKMAQS